MKSATSFISVLALVSVASATVPGCLIAAINKQPVPSDYKSICGAKVNEVKADISSACGSDDLTKVALKDFEDSCKAQGHPIDDSAVTTTTMTTTATVSSTHSVKATATDDATTSVPVVTTTTDAAAESTKEADKTAAATTAPEHTKNGAAPAPKETDVDCTTATAAFPPHWAATSATEVASTPVATHVPHAPGAAKPTGFATVSKPAAPLATGTGAPAPHGNGNGNGNGSAAPTGGNVPAAPSNPINFTGAASSNKLSAGLALVAGAFAFFL